MAKRKAKRRPAKTVVTGEVAEVRDPRRKAAKAKKCKTTTKRKEPRDVTALITAGANVETVVPTSRRDDLTAWLNLYLAIEVEPGSNTYRAKLGDIKWFLRFYFESTSGYECDQWTRGLSKSFLSWIQKQKSERTKKRLAPNTCRRILDTAKRAARWIHRQRPFLAGYPFQDVKDLKVDEPDWKGLTDLEVRRLKSAAEQLIHMSTRADQLPLRNFAILLLLLDTGLRAFELADLQLDQYEDGLIRNVMRKGKDHVTSEIPISRSTVEAVDDYLEHELADGDGPLFESKNGKPINQQIIDQVLRRIAAHANSKLPNQQQIEISPHLLRHTSLRRWAEKKGVRYARQISGQVSDRYIWRYTQPSRQKTRDAVEDLWE
jgi:integrase/recombinase XerD